MDIFQTKLLSLGINPDITATMRRNFALFLFRGMSSYDFSLMIRRYSHCTAADTLALRQSIITDGYILFHLKPYLFYCFKKGIYDKDTCLQLAKEFGVTRADAPLVLQMKKEAVEKKLSPLRKYQALSAEAFRRHLDRMPRRIDEFNGKFAWRKFRFIYQNPHNGMDKEDVEQDFHTYWVQAVGNTYPRVDSTLHLQNIAKHAIHNNGINMITRLTRPCRANLIQENGQSKNVVVSIEAIDPENRIGFNDGDPNDGSRLLEGEIVLSQLESKFADMPKKKTALHCMSGIYNRDFSNWLVDNADMVSHRIDNDLLFTRLLKRGDITPYEVYLRRWLKVNESGMRSFKRELQFMLA